MASVFEVYSTLKDLTNKDARGMITPSQFNAFAGIAQQIVFNKLFDEMRDNTRYSLRRHDRGRDKSRVKQILEDLSHFSTSQTLTADVSNLGIFDKPANLGRIISITSFGDWVLDKTTTDEVYIVYNEEHLDRLLRSDLSSPTEENPIALVSHEIEVFPQSIRKIRLRYYKNPEGISPTTGARVALQPKFGYTISAANQEVFDVANSVDFELPDHYVPELVIEIAKMIGINLREVEVYQYAKVEQQTKDTK